MPFLWITIQNKRANHLELPLYRSAVETEILNLSRTKPLAWNRFIDDIFSLWITERKEIAEFITLPKRHHPTIKLTAEIFEKEINVLDTLFTKARDFTTKESLTSTALRLLRTNSSAKSFYENIYNFKKRFRAKRLPSQKKSFEVKFTERNSAIQKNNEVRKKILPFVTTYHPALPNHKNILMSKWHLV